jgi:tRNA(fMet)-specific endonuclease VapC
VASDLRKAGRTTRARAYDALIAAVAVSRQLPVYTVNPRDFEHISGLELVAVPHPDADDVDRAT